MGPSPPSPFNVLRQTSPTTIEEATLSYHVATDAFRLTIFGLRLWPDGSWTDAGENAFRVERNVGVEAVAERFGVSPDEARALMERARRAAQGS